MPNTDISLQVAGGGNEGVYILRTGKGNDSIYSEKGHIYVTSPFTYRQTAYAADPSSTGLTLLAAGDCESKDCSHGVLGGYIRLDSTVITKNESDSGYVTIESQKHFVRLGSMIHNGLDGDLKIIGDRSVEILNGYDKGKIETTALNGIIIPDNSPDSTGLYISRTGVGNDSILSPAGHIYIRQAFTYDQTLDGDFGTGLTVWADGACGETDCLLGTVGGYVQIDSAVTTTNTSNGVTHIISGRHYVKFDGGFAHTGDSGNLLVSGHTRVDINHAYPADYFHSVISKDIELPKASVDGAIEGVYILRTGPGTDSIRSYAGHVQVTNPFTFVQKPVDGESTINGLNIWANGANNATECDDFVGGYVWLQNDVNTTNQSQGSVSIVSEQHYIRIGKESASGASTGGHLTHKGVDSTLSIWAKGGYDACDAEETDKPDTVLKDRVAHAGRGYLWIGDDVNISFAGGDEKGNALLRSEKDIVQLDDSVTFTDAAGANLWIDGLWGVRTLGPTFLTNVGINDTTGTAPGVQDGYETIDQKGYVTYLSKNGYVDFGIAPSVGTDDPTEIGGNTPFAYTGTQRENALLIEGNRRIFFGDSVTIRMETTNNPNNADPGNAKIYSPEGWIMFADTLGYDGKKGDFIVYANGNIVDGIDTINKRSHWLFNGICDAHEGFVLFDSIARINYTDTGVTWIRSMYDDVVFGDMFTYTNITPADKNGELVIQAGQDIYGRNYDQGFADTIHIVQAGEKSILLEAKKTIHLEQSLLVDRENASTGDITLKSGYPTFSDPDDEMKVTAAGETNPTPSADSSALNWREGTLQAENYTDRFAVEDGRGNYSGSQDGGDIWFEGRVLFDLTQSASTNNDVRTTLRAFNSIFIDSTFVYQQNVSEGGNVLLFAETGNIEAAVTRRDNHGYVADDTVLFDIKNAGFTKDIRIQAGNQVRIGTENTPPTLVADWKKDAEEGAEYFGNILFNKPLLMQNKGKGYTILSAARDIESQIMAPFIFTYDNSESGHLDITAGRHVETHALWQFNYPTDENPSDVTIEAGRLSQESLTASDALCKVTEEGTNLANGTTAFDPDVNTGGVDGAVNNKFAAGGQGNGSILLFDSLEFNYNGAGMILLTAENGNIESDPYLHKHTPSNPGYKGNGYSNNHPLEHDAQITFNHGGSGVTQLKAIDIKLHDKMAYFVTQPAADKKNGQFYVTAYDSILTRNLQYVNPTDTGSVFITTDKYKSYACRESIISGHIVLGYGADGDHSNRNDSIVFDYRGNPSTEGANVYILAGYKGYEQHTVTGAGYPLFNDPRDAGKGWGGNITFDYMEIYMPTGNGDVSGSTRIMTPNGNIWGKDSLKYRGIDGNLTVDAGPGSEDDTLHAVFDLLNTQVPTNCEDDAVTHRTGNIIMKGANLRFSKADGTIGDGHATFRTREGFIDTYDAFTVDSMKTFLLKYAGTDDAAKAKANNWGDVSERDFAFTAPSEGVDIFFGADDNIMLNYGNSNGFYDDGYGILSSHTPGFPGNYNPASYTTDPNPFYYTSYEGHIDDLKASTYDVREDGYLFYRRPGYRPRRNAHLLYRGCDVPNAARELLVDFSSNSSPRGGFAAVASNYIDLFSKFTYQGGNGSGMGAVPGRVTLHGASVAGYGLYIKSQFDGTGTNYPEKRRATCEGCGVLTHFPIEGSDSKRIPEMTYIGFHDDARIHTHNQRSLLEAPVIEFFGHTELDTDTERGNKTKITVKSDSLIFHDSVIFNGSHGIELAPYTTDAVQRANDMRYGVINDRGKNTENYEFYGPAIAMEDRGLPVLELGYQRCTEPGVTPTEAPNARSKAGREPTPRVGGDIIVAFKHGYTQPIFNTVVANNARISFLTDYYDGIGGGGDYKNAFIRTDLLRIRNNVEFYYDSVRRDIRSGYFLLSTPAQMDDRMDGPGIFMRHLHTEPGSELSVPGEDSLIVIGSTVVGGYGTIHDNLVVRANGIVAPGYASLMESDCLTPYEKGMLTVHNLQMNQDAVLRISLGYRTCISEDGTPVNCMKSDVLSVEEDVVLNGKIPVVFLTEAGVIDPGCYEILRYGNLTGVSQEYVKNFVLAQQRIGDKYLTLDYSIPGSVYVCITTIPMPIIQRYVDLPDVEGVTTDPEPRRHYVPGHENFVFSAPFTGSPLNVRATGFYSGKTLNLDYTAQSQGNNTFVYTLYQVVEPWTVYIGPGPSTVSNALLSDPQQRVWAYRNTLYINVEKEDIVSIYNMIGILQRRVEITEGITKFTLERGLYVVTLKDGSTHKIVIR